MRLSHVLAGLVVASLSSAAFAADNYKIDPEHSFVHFRVNHMGVSNTYGRFNDPTGTVTIDPADMSKSSINLEVKADNVDTDNDKRDAHLKNADFFDARQFPTITFKSTAIKGEGDKLEVTGDLTLHGVTKSITVPLTKIGEKETGQMGHRAGWEAMLDLKRSDYGMSNMVGPVGDDIHLVVALEAVKS
ncbi:MAG: YceI family protein [Tepidisphaeraceae bacterium]